MIRARRTSAYAYAYAAAYAARAKAEARMADIVREYIPFEVVLAAVQKGRI